MTASSPKLQKDGSPVFTFRRMGGIDQLVLTEDAEWQNLDKINSKLWMALSCPIQGLEFDAATLAILDADKDGRIRDRDVRGAVAWLCQRLVHPSKLSSSPTVISVADLRSDTDEGRQLAAALGLVLKRHYKLDEDSASLAEIDDVIAEAAGYEFNGDGVVPPDSAPASPDNLRNYIDQGLAIIGGKRDVSGKPGLDESLASALSERLEALAAWRKEIAGAELPLGEKTAEAWTLIQRLGPKIDDYFCRCRLAAFNPDTLALINESHKPHEEQAFQPHALIDRSLLEELPLAKVTPEATLNLDSGLNPAWAGDIQKLHQLVKSLLGQKWLKSPSLTEEDWQAVKGTFSNYAALLDKKPTYDLPPETAERFDKPGFPTLALAGAGDSFGRDFLPLQPNLALDNLSDAQLASMLSSATKEGFGELVAKDKAAPPLSSFQDLRKLSLLQAHIYRFMMNFLSFMDFYDPEKKAIFQTGVLYLDSRACQLCVPVLDIDAHATLSVPSHLCLIYCACTRKAEDGSEQTCNIAAALTLGNLALLIEGRHGLFVDNEGRDWDTKIVRVVHNPISLREACWAPYIRIYNLVGQQVQKLIAAKDKAVEDMGAKVASVATGAEKPPPKAGFDFAKGAGIFAAVGVALSALSATFAYVANSLASLGWWWPLALVLVFICISGPSMLLAWFKLRRRSLGPLLDASGWAVNQGAPINLVMGGALTTLPRLPKGSKRDLNDPYGLPGLMRARKRKMWFWIILLCLIIAACGCFWLYCKLMGEPLWLFQLRAMLGV